MSEMTKKKDEIKLSDHFTYSRLLKFTLPSMAMMIFTSIYGVVDGIFVSNYVGETPFAALNLIMPYVMIFSAIGTMLGVGGSALVAFTLGTGDKEKAKGLPISFMCDRNNIDVPASQVGFLRGFILSSFDK